MLKDSITRDSIKMHPLHPLRRLWWCPKCELVVEAALQSSQSFSVLFQVLP